MIIAIGAVPALSPLTLAQNLPPVVSQKIQAAQKQVGFPANPDLGRNVILQCQSGNRASLAAQSLSELGFTNTAVVVMSLEDWQKTGHPFTK